MESDSGFSESDDDVELLIIETKTLMDKKKKKKVERTVEDLDLEENKAIESMYGKNSTPCCAEGCNRAVDKELAVEHR